MKSVLRAFLRELARHRALALLQVLGVACGVAAAAGMALSARTALTSFEKALAFLQGSATHSLRRAAGPFEETLLPRLARDPAVRALAPVLDRRVRVGGTEQVRLLGVDPLLDARLRPGLYAGIAGDAAARGRLLALASGPPAALLEHGLAASLALSPGASFDVGGRRLLVAGTFASPAGEPLVVADISLAQRLLGAAGVVDRVDLQLEDEAGFRARWAEGFLVQSGSERAATMTAMLEAFRVNLAALSLLALLVGVFLVYNTATFAVVSRRHDAGVLRSLGAGRAQIGAAFCLEVLLLGVVGGALGGALGHGLAHGLTRAVGGTISTLYFFLRPEPPAWSWWVPAAGAALGCAAGLLGALAPLVSLARTPPVQLLGRRAPAPREARNARTAAFGGVLAAAGGVAVLASSGGVAAGIAGSFGVLLGLILGTGLALVALGPPLEWLLTRLGGLPGKLAAGFIRRSLSRTAVAAAAFTVALSMSIGLGTLIGSFRRSLDAWMERQVNGDLYVGNALESSIPEALAAEVGALPGVAGVDRYRYAQVLFRGRPTYVQAVDAAVLQRFARFAWLDDGGDEHWEALRRGSVAVSESFARRFAVRAGERIALEGREGTRTLAVEAVYRDYTTEHGVILMDRPTWLALSGDRTVNTLGVYLDRGHPGHEAAAAAASRLAAARGLPVQRREQLHRAIREVFEATFAVTRSLRLIAVVTAFFGIAGALLTLFVERRREFGVCRALGFSSGQVAGVTLLEGLGLGLASFALSGVAGTVVAALLVRVVNLRSFHWTVSFHPAWESYAAAAAVAVAASLAAAAYPAWLVRRTYPQLQLREE